MLTGLGLTALQAAPVLVVFGVLYWLYLRPIRIAHKRHQEMLSHLKIGDPVVLESGLYGRIKAFQESGAVLLTIRHEFVVPARREAVAEVVSEEEFTKAWSEKEAND